MAINAEIAGQQLQELLNKVHKNPKTMQQDKADKFRNLIKVENGEEKAPPKKIKKQQENEIKACLEEVTTLLENQSTTESELDEIQQKKQKVQIAKSAHEMAEAVSELLALTKK